MNSSYIRYFIQHVEKVPSFAKSQVFFRDEGVWKSARGVNEIGGEHLPEIPSFEKNERTKKIRGTSYVAFLLGDGKITVVVKLAPKTQGVTIHRHLARLDECLISATSSFHAHHDELTGVLNRHGIKYSLANACGGSFPNGALEVPEQQLSSSMDIILYALDIDHFKMVNDTYGHEAGDYILSTFATRIDALAEILSSEYSSELIFGRPGGEEFELIAIGAISMEDRLQIGERLLAEIRQPIASVPIHARRLTIKDDGTDLPIGPSRLPSKVTASIGVAWIKKPEDLNDIESAHSTLRKEADAALYRGKADGRNCLRAYANIRRKHGRVIEFYQDSELVQVDIGANVGVERGQFYAVYFPPFTGLENNLDSNNTKKNMLGYPLIESARIKVIDVQKEVSTAMIVMCIAERKLPIGSLLRYVHTGSTFLPVERNSNLNTLVLPISFLTEDLAELNRKNEMYALMAIGGRSRSDDLRNREERQDSFLALAHLQLPSGAKIYYSHASQMFVTIPMSASETLTKLKSRLEIVKEKFQLSGMAIIAGICVPKLLQPTISRSPADIAFYSKAALKVVGAGAKEFVFFGEATPSNTVNRWRKEEDFENALVDYQKFRTCGFDMARLDNQIGLAIMESDAKELFTLAEAAFSRAAEANEDEKIYRANLGLLQTHQAQYAIALKTFQSIEVNAEALKTLGKLYVLAFAKCALAVQGSPNAMENESLANLLLAAGNSYTSPPAMPYESWWKEVSLALKSKAFD